MRGAVAEWPRTELPVLLAWLRRPGAASLQLRDPLGEDAVGRGVPVVAGDGQRLPLPLPSASTLAPYQQGAACQSPGGRRSSAGKVAPRGELPSREGVATPEGDVPPTFCDSTDPYSSHAPPHDGMTSHPDLHRRGSGREGDFKAKRRVTAGGRDRTCARTLAGVGYGPRVGPLQSLR